MVQSRGQRIVPVILIGRAFGTMRNRTVWFQAGKPCGKSSEDVARYSDDSSRGRRDLVRGDVTLPGANGRVALEHIERAQNVVSKSSRSRPDVVIKQPRPAVWKITSASFPDYLVDALLGRHPPRNEV